MKTFTKILMIISMSVGLCACDPDDDMMKTGSGSGTDGGSAVSRPTTGPEAFLGRWQYVAGTSQVTITCSDGTSFDAVAEGTESETFTAGSTPDTVVATGGNGCVVECAVSGKTATCPVSGCLGLTITNDAYTLVGDEMHEAVTADATLDDGTPCDLTMPNGVLKRVP